MSKLEELLERVRAATGPDRELDFAIGLASGVYKEAGPVCGPRHTHDNTRYVTYLHSQQGAVWHGAIGACIPNLTDSIDAAVTLALQCLPGMNCYGVERDPRGWDAHVSRNWVNDRKEAWLFHEEGRPTAPLAILAALLSALIAQEPAP